MIIDNAVGIFPAKRSCIYVSVKFRGSPEQRYDIIRQRGEESADTADAGAENAASIVSAPTELTYIFADGDEGAKVSMNSWNFSSFYPVGLPFL